MGARSVEAVIAPGAPRFVGDGFRVVNFMPGHPLLSMERMDPFILLDYNPRWHFAPSERPRGVGAHPHKGFETVTIAYHGRVAHHDSTGAGGVIGEGDVQWMTAASGLLHKEYHEAEWSRRGGLFQMVQLWVNLPAEAKKHAPRYQALPAERMGRAALPDGRGEVAVIAGEYQGTKGPAATFTPMHVYNMRLKAGAEAGFSFPAAYHTALLVVEGDLRVNGTAHAPTDHLVLMANDGEAFTVQAGSDALVLVLSGEPIGEPIAAHGPFVMNTWDEVRGAFREFEEGRFGVLR